MGAFTSLASLLSCQQSVWNFTENPGYSLATTTLVGLGNGSHHINIKHIVYILCLPIIIHCECAYGCAYESVLTMLLPPSLVPFTWRNLWLPSSTRINSSVRPSVCPSVRPSVRPYGPADYVLSGKWHRPNRFGQLFFKIMNPRES